MKTTLKSILWNASTLRWRSQQFIYILVLAAVAGACSPVIPPSPSATSAIDRLASASESPHPIPSQTDTPSPALTPTSTSVRAVASLRATVIVDLLSCRYGPGAPYLFLYGLRNGANIKLIGRTDGANWNWVYVDGTNKCWVNARYLQVQGDILGLPVVYPGIARLPVSPYYPPTAVLGAIRQGSQVTVNWLDIPLRPGDEEDERMLHYIVEAWHCVGDKFVFEPLATNGTSIVIVDEEGCDQPSHARLFVQEKHGLAGPTDIPWPGFN